MQQRQPGYYNYSLDDQTNNIPTPHCNAGPSHANSFDQVDPAAELSSLNNTAVLRGGTDFRRRKNWPERILVEITGLLHVLSSAGKILYCSESTHELTGYRPHELVGQALMDFLHVDDMDVFIRDFEMSFHTRSQIKTHYRFRKKDDSYIIFEVVGHPRSDVPGQPPQSFFGIAQPIPTKSGASIDTFLELKAENDWLRKRIDELSSISTNSNTIEINNSNKQDSDIEEFMPLNPQATGSSSSSSSNNDKPQQQDAYDRKDKRKRKKKYKGEEEYVCTDCGTTCSPEWRKGPHGPKTLCNACGLRWAKKNKKRDDLNDD